MSDPSSASPPPNALLAWSKEQPWWPCVSVLLQQGLVVSLHVPVGMMPPGDKHTLLHRPSGGRIEIKQCDGMPWHVFHAVHHLVHEAALEMLEALKEAHVQHDSMTRPNFGHRAPEVGEA